MKKRKIKKNDDHCPDHRHSFTKYNHLITHHTVLTPFVLSLFPFSISSTYQRVHFMAAYCYTSPQIIIINRLILVTVCFKPNILAVPLN